MSGNKKWSLAGLAALCLFAGSASFASAGEDIARQEAPSKAYLDFYGEEDPSSVPATGDVMEPLFVAEELLQSLPKPEEVKTVGNLKLKKEEAPVKEPTLPPGTPAAPPASSAATQAPPARTSAPKSAASASAPVNYPAPSAGGESVGTLTAVGILLAAVASIAAIVLNVLSFTTYLN